MEVVGIKGVPARFRTVSKDKQTLIHIYDTIPPAFPNCLLMSRESSFTHIIFYSISNCLTLSDRLFIGIQMTVLSGCSIETWPYEHNLFLQF